MAEELVYNENLIIQFSTADFQAFALNDDDEVETNIFSLWMQQKDGLIIKQQKNEDNNRNGEIHLEYHCR